MGVERIRIQLSILKGEGLVAKDRNIFGKKTSSDPYVEVWANNHKIGKTSTQKKTLNPIWTNSHNKFDMEFHGKVSNKFIALKIYDEDLLSSPDSMGTITIPVTNYMPEGNKTEWYDVPKHSAKNASGRIQVQMNIKLVRSQDLIRGNAFDLTVSNRIQVGLAWDMVHGREVDLDVSCVSLNNYGQVSMADSVYYGNKQNSNESVLHSGDEQEGDEEGDDESITFQLDQIPSNILAMYIILTVATPNMRIPDIQSTKLSVYNIMNYRDKIPICSFTPATHALSENATAMFMVRIARAQVNSRKWILSPIEDTHPTARDFGSLAPYLKSYTRDLLPNLQVDPTERIAILRKGGNIRLADYVRGGTIPDLVTFGLAWDMTGGKEVDLDASCICLDKDLNLIDLVWWKQLKSNDGSIRHQGDEREGDEVGDDEKINLNVNRISQNTHYIGFCINSYSGEELDDVARASCHLFDPSSNVDMASYALTDASSLDKHTALLVACMYRGSSWDEWCLCIISQPAQGKTIKYLVPTLQNYLKHHPPQPPRVTRPQEVVEVEMPQYVPIVENVSPVVHSPPPADGNGPPPKFITVDGIKKLNPEYKKYKDSN